MRMKICLFLPAVLLCAAFAQDPSDRLIGEALKLSSLETNLRRLTDEIGGRVPGTPAMQKAVNWGVQAFNAAGADSVDTEKFTIPFSWAEGDTQMSVVTPEQFKVRVVSVAWAPALVAQQQVPVDDVGEGTAADFAKAGNLAIPNHIGRPITTENVVAEVRGGEKTDQFVVLGAELDSWELRAGAPDNGCKAALGNDALRAIKASGLRPRRSSRFILFSGEE